jgi:ubiquitin-conjugating enzyme E2 D/E
MAEPVGIVLGVLGISGLLSVSLDCFNFVQDGMSLGKDFAHIDGQLSTLRIRLYAWGKACGFFSDEGYDKRLDNPQWRSHIRRQLSCISLLFLDTEKIVSKYNVAGNRRQSMTGPLVANEQFINQGIRDYLVKVKMTKKNAGLTGQFQWALVYKRRMTELLQRLKDCVEALELVSKDLNLFEKQCRAVRTEIRMMRDTESLRNIVTVGPSYDIVSDAASERLLQLEGIQRETDTTAAVSTLSLEGGSTIGTYVTAVDLGLKERDSREADEAGESVSPETWNARNSHEPPNQEVLQKIIISMVLERKPKFDKGPTQCPFGAIRYLVPRMFAMSADDLRTKPLANISREVWLSPGTTTQEIRHRLEEFSLPKPNRIMQGTLSEMQLIGEGGQCNSLQALFDSFLQAQFWPEDGLGILEAQRDEIQGPFKLRECCSSVLLFLYENAYQSTWGHFERHGDYVAFHPTSTEVGKELFMIWLQAFATNKLEHTLIDGPNDQLPEIITKKDHYLQNVDAAEMEKLLTCFMEIFASGLFVSWITIWLRRLENSIPEMKAKEETAEQQTRVMSELSQSQIVTVATPRLDDGRWGWELAQLAKSDQLWLTENPPWLTGFQYHFGNTGGLRRLSNELRAFLQKPVGCITMRPLSIALDGKTSIRASFEGPPQSSYRGGIFHLLFKCPMDYAFAPPTVHFLTRVYHPNIGCDGEICMDRLQTRGWSPALTIEKVVLSVMSLLSDPNIENPLVPEIATTFVLDRSLYDKNARLYTVKYAGGDQDYPDYGVVPFSRLISS